MGIRSNHHIGDMAPYAVASFDVPNAVPLLSMAQNESLRPPSPKVNEVVQRTLGDAADYPDPDYPELRRSIAELHNINPDNILLGAGSMELITCITHAYAGPDRRVLTTEYGYALFRNSAEKVGAVCDLAPEENFTVSADALLNSLHHDTRLVFVANPGNPTGTRLPRSEIVRLRDALPDDILLVVDEAYGEFADGLEEPLFPLVERENTVILRTFSKAYGLASARVGWGLFPSAVGAELRKLIIPSSISSISAAMAMAALEDQHYMQETCSQTAEAREMFAAELKAIGLKGLNSHTNFVLIEFPDIEQAMSADKALRDVGIVMRAMGGYALPHCLRATITRPATMRLAIETLQRWNEERSR